ncbi:hypothetical protein BDC45DRAFT_572894 [Circinella umbellata]|nr:hypothetical protein BDC45DRAFT_572894 [Circinella umbellata]
MEEEVPTWTNLRPIRVQDAAVKFEVKNTADDEPDWMSVMEKKSRASRTTTTKKSSKASTPLKVSMVSNDKQHMVKILDGVDHKKFWSLNDKTVVDQEVIDFAKKCNYHQKTPVDAYNYGRNLPHNPIKEPLKAWLALGLQNTARLHFYTGGEFHLERLLESDQLYEALSFLKSVVHGSHIIVRDKECSSKANCDAINKKRYISAVEPTSDQKMGHKMDTIYTAGHREIGYIEIGKEDDQTKEMKDGLLKMHIVMHDMLIQLAYTETLVRKVHVVGFLITGSKITMLDMDSPGGFVTRIRRTEALYYPSGASDYISSIIPLFRLSLTALTIMNKTKIMIDSATKSMGSLITKSDWMLPPTFIPCASLSNNNINNNSSSEASSSSSAKKQKNN